METCWIYRLFAESVSVRLKGFRYPSESVLSQYFFSPDVRPQDFSIPDVLFQPEKVKKGKGLLFNVDSLRKSPPGMDGTTYFQQSPRCVSLPPRLSSLGRYCWQQYPVRLPPSSFTFFFGVLNGVWGCFNGPQGRKDPVPCPVRYLSNLF